MYGSLNIVFIYFLTFLQVINSFAEQELKSGLQPAEVRDSADEYQDEDDEDEEEEGGNSGEEEDDLTADELEVEDESSSDDDSGHNSNEDESCAAVDKRIGSSDDENNCYSDTKRKSVVKSVNEDEDSSDCSSANHKKRKTVDSLPTFSHNVLEQNNVNEMSDNDDQFNANENHFGKPVIDPAFSATSNTPTGCAVTEIEVENNDKVKENDFNLKIVSVVGNLESFQSNQSNGESSRFVEDSNRCGETEKGILRTHLSKRGGGDTFSDDDVCFIEEAKTGQVPLERNIKKDSDIDDDIDIVYAGKCKFLKHSLVL